MKDNTTLESRVYIPQPEPSFRDRLEELLQGPHHTAADAGLAAYMAGCLMMYPEPDSLPVVPMVPLS